MAANSQFRKYVKLAGSQAIAARALNLSSGHVSLLYNGKRPVTVAIAERVEKASRGAISRESLIFPERKKAAA
jgi:DNA-binding transcriptional regulator YdaS (Cro superfamily)